MNTTLTEKIKPCPFCGGEAFLITRGNAFTKKRSAEIECSKCRTKQITAAIHSSIEWCSKTAIEKWNKRFGSKTLEGVPCLDDEKTLVNNALFNGDELRRAYDYCRNNIRELTAYKFLEYLLELNEQKKVYLD